MDDMRRPEVSGPKVFVVDNDPATCRSLAWLLESAGLTTQTFETAEAFLAARAADEPGCLLLDLRLPGMSGAVLQAQLAELGVGLPVIVVTGFADVATAVLLLKRGAFDVLEKPIAEELLLERVQEALEIDAQRRSARAHRDALMARLSCLTAREREVFDQVVRGKANKVVAIDLGISEKTVEAHRARVMQKLGAGSLAELVRIDLLAAGLGAKLPPAELHRAPAPRPQAAA
jgi:FixJ family two-component response regulator